jgi:seryl-tRNA synthetase
MLDIKEIQNNTEAVRKALLKRVQPEDLYLEEILKDYEEYKAALVKFEKKRSKQNSFNDKMAELEKGSEEFEKMIQKLRDLSSEVKEFEKKAEEKKSELNDKISKLPNIPDEDIPAGGKENNEVLREWGEEHEKDFELKSHIELGKDLGILDFERAAKISGAHMPMYRGGGAMLEWALINYFIKQHVKDGYECVIPPHLLNEKSAYVAGQLPKFQDDVYWTQDDQCLLPTAETALTNMYREEILDEEDLPKKFFSYTPCYRREAGAYGKDDKGLMRIHQFNKVEMFQYVSPDNWEEAFDEMINKGEKLLQDLGLRYQVSKLAAEDMSFGMARTYDIEAYLPYQDIYKEVSSASNARDFQARRGNMRYRDNESGEVKFLYTLNASGLATSRLLIAILETYQNKDGSVTVPEVLRDYMGTDKIEAVK